MAAITVFSLWHSIAQSHSVNKQTRKDHSFKCDSCFFLDHYAYYRIAQLNFIMLWIRFSFRNKIHSI